MAIGYDEWVKEKQEIIEDEMKYIHSLVTKVVMEKEFQDRRPPLLEEYLDVAYGVLKRVYAVVEDNELSPEEKIESLG